MSRVFNKEVSYVCFEMGRSSSTFVSSSCSGRGERAERVEKTSDQEPLWRDKAQTAFFTLIQLLTTFEIQEIVSRNPNLGS